MPSRNIETLEDAGLAIGQLTDDLNKLRTNDWDFHLRRIKNAAPSEAPNDYVIQQEVVDAAAALQSNIDALRIRIDELSQAAQKPQELFAECTSTLTVPFGSYGDVAGCTVSLNRMGLYVVTAYVSVVGDAAATGSRIVLNVDGSLRTPIILIHPSAGTITGTFAMTWPVFKQTQDVWVAKLQADKLANLGTSLIRITDTILHARWAGADVSVAA